MLEVEPTSQDGRITAERPSEMAKMSLRPKKVRAQYLDNQARLLLLNVNRKS